MYLVFVSWKENFEDNRKGYSKVFQTKKEADQFSWDVLNNNIENLKHFVTMKSEVIELDNIFKD
jgi:hypothetical protein